MTSAKISLYYIAGPHPVNESFVRTPPSNVALKSNIRPESFEDFSRPKEFRRSWRKKKRFADAIFRTLSIPRTVPALKKCDLVHTNGGIVPLSFVPWVASVENPSGFYGFRENWHEISRMKRRLAAALLANRCRSILPYSEASRRYIALSLEDWFEEINEKMTMLYPAVDEYIISPASEIETRFNRDDAIRFLFVGDHFFDKGGREVLRAFEHVREEIPCELTFVTSAPSHHSKEYEIFRRRIASTPHVNLIPTGIRRRELLALYRNSDVFVFPSYMDQVPFVLLEAMAAGLALIGSNSFAIPEMVLSGVNGFNVESQCLAFPRDRLRSEKSLVDYRRDVLNEGLFEGVVDSLIDIMLRYAKSRELVCRCGSESLKLATSGRFSVGFRNSILARVYAEAVSSF